MENIGRLLILIAVFLALTGILFILLPKIPFFSNLPGDISAGKGNWRIFFPFGSSIAISLILSLILTIVLNIVIRLFWK